MTSMPDAIPRANKVREQLRSSMSKVEWLKLISAILVPMMIGIFTIVTTIQQLQSDNEARNTSLFIAQLQRDIGIHMAEELRRENLFNAYVHDLIIAVQENNWTVHAKHALRAKTIATFRELDGVRKGRLVQFMYEYYVVRFNNSALLFVSNDLDLSHLIFESPVERPTRSLWLRFDNLALPNAVLQKASFANIFLFEAYLPNTILSHANFTNCYMLNGDFRDALLDDTDFTGAVLWHADFTRADFSRSNINITPFERSSHKLKNIIYPNGTHAATIRPANLVPEGDAENSGYKCSPMNKWTTENVAALQYGSLSSHLLVSDAYDGISNNCVFLCVDNDISFMSMKDDIFLYDYRRLIQLGRAEFELSAWLGGVGNSSACFTVVLRFYNSIGRVTVFSLGKAHDHFSIRLC